MAKDKRDPRVKRHAEKIALRLGREDDLPVGFSKIPKKQDPELGGR